MAIYGTVQGTRTESNESPIMPETPIISRRRAALLMMLAIYELFFFSLIIDGWPALNNILKADGVFSNFCHLNQTVPSHVPCWNNTECINREYPHFHTQGPYVNNTDIWPHGSVPGIADTIRPLPTCQLQDEMLNLVYLITNFLGQGLSSVLGYVFDKFGLRISRLFSSVCFFGGIFMLSFRNPAWSWLTFPGFALIGISGVMTVLTSTHTALLAGKFQSTYLSILSGVINTCGFVPAIMQITYNGGLSRQTCLYIFASLYLVHLVNTFCFTPRFKYYPPRADTILASVDDTDDLPDSIATPDTGRTSSFRRELLSPVYITHTVWYSVLQLCFWFTLASYNSWLGILTNNNQEEVTRLTLVFEYTTLSTLVIAPLTGLMTDSLVTKACEKDTDNVESRTLLNSDDVDASGRFPAPVAFVPALLIAVMAAVSLSVSSLVWKYTSAINVSVYASILKATLFATHFAFIQMVFAPEHYGKAFGISVTIACLFGLLEIPLYSWATSAELPFAGAHGVLLVLCGISLAHPISIWIRKNPL